MFEHLRPSDSLVWTIAWQSSAFLALGLAMSLALRKRPARAHWVLLSAMLAALASPALTETGRRLGWGLWTSPAPAVETTIASTSGNASGPFVQRPEPPPMARPVSFPEAPRPAEAATIVEPIARPSFSWRSAFLIGWAAASFLLFARLVVSFVGGWRLARSAREVDDAGIRAWVDEAADRLGLRAVPKVRRLSAVSCPAVWCWGRAPLLLLPEGGDAQGVDWAGVFRHELAHWSRRDHISSLVGEILVCALPWHPLAWWSRGRLAQLAELACDDWVLAGGVSPADYAESLLALTPQRRSAALAAVSSRRGLMSRVRRILTESRREPTLGAPWTFAVCLGLLAAVSALALAQARPAKAKADDAPKADQAAMKTLRGKVLAPDGKPLAGASVVWVGNRKQPLPIFALPKDERDAAAKVEAIAQTQSGDDGTFQLSAPLPANGYVRDNSLGIVLMAAATGYGLAVERVSPKNLDSELTLKAPEQVVIHGRLLAPGGMPAAGVRVTLGGFHNHATEEGISILRPGVPDETPASWPRPRVTDSDGRFTMEGIPAGTYANLVFENPDYAVDEVTVNAIPEGAVSSAFRSSDIVPIKPTFTHTLEAVRSVAGRVVDKGTGEPLAGMFVEVNNTRRPAQYFTTRTDADGRYRVDGLTTQGEGTLHTTIYPNADSGYLGRTRNRNDWPDGVGTLEVDFEIEKGRLVQGRVVDQDGRRPIAGAAVVYQPALGNPNYTDRYDLSNTVITDADGRFTITALPGEGFVAVETPSPDAYIRTPIQLAGPLRLQEVYPQGFVKIDVPKEGEPKPVEVVVRKGVPLEARVVDPDGRPVESVTAMYTGIDAALVNIWNSGWEFPGGEFRIPGADPEKTYRVFFSNFDRRLGVVAELKYDPSGKPLEVRLQPTATIRGKLATLGGAPPPKAPKGSRVDIRLIVKPERRAYVQDDLFNRDKIDYYANVIRGRYYDPPEEQPKDDGAFEFDALIPGVGYYVTGHVAGQFVMVPVWDLKPGEVRDLGTVTPDEKGGR